MGRSYDEEYVEFADAALPHLQGTAYLLCGDWHRADDLAQEALVKLYVVWPRVSRRGGLMPYARRIVVRLLVDESRRPWRREVSHSALVDVTGSGQPDSADQVHNRMMLIRALQGISIRRRACIVLRYFNDLSVQETADALGCSEGTVKSQTSRGLADLRTALEAVGFTRIDVRGGVVAT